jgi:O6-methylguanine-DNA--protein-cysteine methyltransferase
MYYCYLDTPIGELLLAGDEDALCFIGFPEGSMRLEAESDWIFTEKPFAAAQEQLTSYFAGERNSNSGCLMSCRRSLMEQQRPMATLQTELDGRKRFARLVRRMAETRCPSLFRVIGSSALAVS